MAAVVAAAACCSGSCTSLRYIDLLLGIVGCCLLVSVGIGSCEIMTYWVYMDPIA